MLIAPGGQIVRRWRDMADRAELKSEIVDRLGRTYASRKEAGSRKQEVETR